MSGPLPPDDIAARSLPLLRVPAGAELHRFYARNHVPVYFSPGGGGRLNSPDGKYGVLYAAAQPEGAFAETFLRSPGRTLITSDLLARKGYAVLQPSRALRLVMLYGPGLAKLGATAEVTHSGLPYDVPQAWSAALHAHPANADGIAYRARHDDDEICYAVFDRARGHIAEVRRETDLDADWFYRLAERYGAGLAP